MTTDLIPVSAQNVPESSVTLITALAETADLEAIEYRQIYNRVAAGRSLRNVELALRSAVTFGWWAKYAAGERSLDRNRKNELRRWASANGGPDLPDLPPTVGEAVAAHTHPDAAVYRIGAEIASRIVLVGADVEAVTLRLNGACTVAASAPGTLPLESSQVTCNTRYTPRSYKSLSVSVPTHKRLSAARQKSGLTWDRFIARAEIVDDLVAALREVDRYLEPDPDALVDPWGAYERLTATVRSALEHAAVRNGKRL
jgi:hypothetical protein